MRSLVFVAGLPLYVLFVSGCGREGVPEGRPSPIDRIISEYRGENVLGPVSLPSQNWIGEAKSTHNDVILPLSLNAMIPSGEDKRFSENSTDKRAFYQVGLGEDAPTFLGSIGVVSHVLPAELSDTGKAWALKERLFVNVQFQSAYYGSLPDEALDQDMKLTYNDRFSTIVGEFFPEFYQDSAYEGVTYAALHWMGESVRKQGQDKVVGIVMLDYLGSDEVLKKIKIAEFSVKSQPLLTDAFSNTSDFSAETEQFRYHISFEGFKTTYSVHPKS